jgi:hypothetical protein
MTREKMMSELDRFYQQLTDKEKDKYSAAFTALSEKDNEVLSLIYEACTYGAVETDDSHKSLITADLLQEMIEIMSAAAIIPQIESKMRLGYSLLVNAGLTGQQ